MIQLFVYAGLAVLCIAVAAVLHFLMPESTMPVIILGAATATLIPGVVSAVKELNEREKRREEAELRRIEAEAKWHEERDRANTLFEETQTLKRHPKQ